MDSQRLILLMVFLFSLVMLWDGWNRHGQPKQQGPVAATQPKEGSPVPEGSVDKLGSSVGIQKAALSEAASSPAPIVTVTTDVMKVTVSTRGGDISRVELLKHQSSGTHAGGLVLLDLNGEHRYGAQSGLIGEGMPNHKSVFAASADRLELREGENEVVLVLTGEGEKGISLQRAYTFRRGSYAVGIEETVKNGSGQEVTPFTYLQVVRDGKAPEGGVPMMSTFTGPALYTEETKYKKVEFGDLEKPSGQVSVMATDGWIGMVQHYFVSAWVPEGGGKRELFARKIGDEYYSAGVVVGGNTIAAGGSGKARYTFYAGPQEQDKLQAIAPGLDLVVDYGWLHVIAAPLFWVLQAIHRVVGNWGWAIVLLTVLVKLVFFPLSAASYKSMARMRKLTPRLQQLKERCGDDRQKLNQEMMELYKKEKINPFGGCLPILIQIPVFIALYWVLLGSVEMRNAPWVLWIKDLSVMDPYYVLPLIMGASMFVQTKLNPAPPDPIQAKIMLFMPVIFTGMFLFFPAGLVLYWIVNNVLSIAQQWQITRMIEGGKAAG